MYMAALIFWVMTAPDVANEVNLGSLSLEYVGSK